MLQSEDFLLLFYLSCQLFFSWQKSEILGLIDMFVVIQNGVLGHIFAGIRAKNKPYCRMVTLSTFQFVVHSDIHIHLPYVLMCYLTNLQIYEQKAFLYVIVEHQVDKEISHICPNVLLSCNKGKATSHLHDELLYMVDNGTLQLIFVIGTILW